MPAHCLVKINKKNRRRLRNQDLSNHSMSDTDLKDEDKTQIEMNQKRI